LIFIKSIHTYILFLSASGNISNPGYLFGYVGEHIDFKFTTNDGNSILSTNFGIKGGGVDDFKIKLIVVTNKSRTQRISCGEDLDSPRGASYKNRVQFIGNIREGRAWFRITSITMNDTNTYMAGIREDTDETSIMYNIKLLAKQQSMTGTLC
jgi:hypothetical protein